MDSDEVGIFASEEIQDMDNIRDTECDPLDGIGEKNNVKYYRLNDTVFAEPIAPEDVHDKGTKEHEEFTIIDKVIVQKALSKKYRKFHMDIEKHSLTCPQENCGKSFKTQTLLKAHIRKVHCAVCMFVCDVCGITCTAKYLLVRHMAVHERKRVECPVCKKMLSVRTSLSVHLRSHTNTRKHECGICHKRFLRRSTMNNHVKFVHGKGGIACDKCGGRFGTRSEQTRHKCEYIQSAVQISE